MIQARKKERTRQSCIGLDSTCLLRLDRAALPGEVACSDIKRSASISERSYMGIVTI
jgi:hypothetical protein